MGIEVDKKILVVDDMDVMQKIIIVHLEKLGFSVQRIQRAPNGLEALKLLLSASKENEPFDLVICDWNMPTMTGLDFLKTIRSTPEHKNIPFLMVTSEDNKNMKYEAFKEGVTEYIVKPVETYKLAEKLEKIFII
jgi:two-component system, chemotaxis family, chemotaxis protein CheY